MHIDSKKIFFLNNFFFLIVLYSRDEIFEYFKTNIMIRYDGRKGLSLIWKTIL